MPSIKCRQLIGPLRVLLLLVLTEVSSNSVAGYLMSGFLCLTSRSSGGLPRHQAGHHHRQSGQGSILQCRALLSSMSLTGSSTGSGGVGCDGVGVVDDGELHEGGVTA